MSEDPTKTLPPEDGNGLAEDDVRSINLRLQRLEDKFDERSRETRPMSERIDQILAEVAATHQDVKEVNGRMDRVETELTAVRRETKEVNRSLHRLQLDFATIIRNEDELEDRVTRSKINCCPKNAVISMTRSWPTPMTWPPRWLRLRRRAAISS